MLGWITVDGEASLEESTPKKIDFWVMLGRCFFSKTPCFFWGGLSNAWGRHNFTHLEHIVWWTKGSASYFNLHWQICRISMKCWSLNRHNTWSIFILPIFGEKNPSQDEAVQAASSSPSASWELFNPTLIPLEYIYILKTRNPNQAWPFHAISIWRISYCQFS